jgi:hypothetical protein
MDKKLNDEIQALADKTAFEDLLKKKSNFNNITNYKYDILKEMLEREYD